MKNYIFLCHAMYQGLCIGESAEDVCMKNYLPELYAQKPKTPYTNLCWYDATDYGYKKRIEALKQAIKLTHPDL